MVKVGDGWDLPPLYAGPVPLNLGWHAEGSPALMADSRRDLISVLCPSVSPFLRQKRIEMQLSPCILLSSCISKTENRLSCTDGTVSNLNANSVALKKLPLKLLPKKVDGSFHA
jgi:hypothetical protein